MPNTYVALDKVTVGTATPSITFSGINQGYTDLVIVVVPATTSGNDNLGLRVGNGSVDTGSNYSVTVLTGNGSAASSDRQSNQTSFLCDYYGSTGATLGNNIKVINIMNYSNTTTNKTILLRANRADSGTDAIVGLWRSTVAINTVTLFGRGGSSFAVGSTFSLYGIANSDLGAAKATGGMITEDATYWYHTFAASGTFTPKQSLSCDLLVIAGGGGGGNQQAGGGGAGGLLGFTSQTVSTAQTVTIGAGGAGSTNTARGVTGNDSQFGALTLVKGGGGGGSFSDPASGNNTGAAGGSGGGGGTAGQSNNTQAGGAATSGQGNAGGSGQLVAGTWRNGGGGGGAGGAGVNAAASSPTGTGGAGSSDYSSWASVTSTGVSGSYAGGGGGGGNTRGLATAGGGNGATDVAGSNGTAFTGGGGGGGGYSSFSAGYSGGSGVVIVRYAK